MKILICSKYLTFPVNTNTVAKKVIMMDGDEVVFDFDCKIDMLSPNFTAYIDVTRFYGQTLEILTEPAINFNIGITDEMNLIGLYEEELRPKVHFTVKNGWNNDPNGLIYKDGIFHMFYQYNPCATEWERGSIHWGHATSTDLVHWEEKDIALYPNEFGSMYSGSAIEDTRNVTGLKDGDSNPMLLYYTACGDSTLLSSNKMNTICLAYSIDGGITFKDYCKNPLIHTITPENRDPKVVWVEDIQKYILVIYLEEDEYAMFSSQNLLDWQHYQNIKIHGDSECPDIYCINCEGERKWVFLGASNVYLVGNFTNDGFICESEECKFTYSNVMYAAQCFSGIENRVVRISWERLGIPGIRFSEQMSIPTEMRLEKINGKYYLSALPVKEIEKIYIGENSENNFLLDTERRVKVGTSALDIHLVLDYVPDSVIDLNIYGAELKINTDTNSISYRNSKMPISVLKKTVDIRVIVDRCSIELFTDEGKFNMAVKHMSDYNLPYIALSANSSIKVQKFSCREMCSAFGKI